MFSNLNGDTPNLLHNYFQTSAQLHSYNTRNNDKILVGFSRTRLRMSSLSIAGPQCWNSIPLIIKLSKSLHSFKVNFKKWLLDTY